MHVDILVLQIDVTTTTTSAVFHNNNYLEMNTQVRSPGFARFRSIIWFVRVSTHYNKLKRTDKNRIRLGLCLDDSFFRQSGMKFTKIFNNTNTWINNTLDKTEFSQIFMCKLKMIVKLTFYLHFMLLLFNGFNRKERFDSKADRYYSLKAGCQQWR